MSPGPKKKGRKDFSSQRGNVRQINPSTRNVLNEDQEVNKKNEAGFQNDVFPDARLDDGSCVKNDQRKYSKRQIQNNWDRYEERTPGLLEDTLRGESFEVLACYQGGADSYLKLKEEKEWCNAKDLQDDLCLDCHELAQSLKCIPLHKRLHISEVYFTAEMLQKFKAAAERSCSWKPSTVKSDLLAFGTFPNSEDMSSEVTYKPKLISEETENIILSLTKCTLKDEKPKTAPEVKETPIILTSSDTHHDSVPQTESHGDLALLLSLSGSDKHVDDKAEEKGSSASIEDWLNELLEK